MPHRSIISKTIMRRFLFIITLLTLFVGCESLRDKLSGRGSLDWLIFRGNSSLSGYTNLELPDNLTALWSYKSDARTISSPVIMNGTTYWCDVRGRVRGVDIEGNAVFEYDLQTPVEATPMIFDSTLYIGSIEGTLTALSLHDRDTLWSYQTEGQISGSPNVVDSGKQKSIVVGSYDNYMYNIDINTGSLINKFESGYYLNGAVATHASYSVFGGCDAWLRVVDCQQGIAVDSLQLAGYVPASPAIDGDRVYVGDYSGNIYEIGLKDGRITDNRTLIVADDNNGSFVSVPAVSPSMIYVTSSDKYLYAINRKTGEVGWRYLLKGNVGESSPVVAGNKVVVCTKTGVVSIMDAKSGELCWEYDTGEQILSSPAVVRDHLFILTAKGTLFCFGEKNS